MQTFSQTNQIFTGQPSCSLPPISYILALCPENVQENIKNEFEKVSDIVHTCPINIEG